MGKDDRHGVKDVARLTGVTVRTLHYYDQLGLLVPSERTEAGYRLFSDADLLRLQQILIHRELGFPLERIKRILDDPAFDRRRALLEQREKLVERAGRTDAMIRAVDAALEAIEGGSKMDAREIFAGFDAAEHEDETRRRWGHTDAYREASRRTAGYSEEDWMRIKAEDDALMKALAEQLRAGAPPDDPNVVELAEQHRRHIDRWYYPCSRARHTGLAELYVADPRFAAAFDRHAEGLALFVAEAIRANARRE